jgi:uncharacterized Zn finger protein (UPF0148 family)
MGIKKELSKKCGNCGVEWLSDLSNKKEGRALCNECYTIESQKHSKEQRERRAAIGALENRIELYKDYKFENRKEFWREINKELKSLTKREDIRAFISKQMDRILNDRKLMEYINLKSEENKK